MGDEPTISRSDVEHVARLARLDLTPDEVAVFQVQLDAVLERARRIQSLDLDDVEPTAHPLDVVNVLRSDTVTPPHAAAEIVQNAPDREDAFFKVPPIMDAGD